MEFLTHDDRQMLFEAYNAAIAEKFSLLSDEEKKGNKDLIEQSIRDAETDIDYLDFYVSHLDLGIVETLSLPDLKSKFLDNLNMFIGPPIFNLTKGMFPVLNNIMSDSDNSLEVILNQEADRIEIVKKISNIFLKFPFLFSKQIYNNIVDEPIETFYTFLPQINYLNELTYEDIGKGNLDFSFLKKMVHKYTPFTPVFLNFIQLEKMPLKEGYAYMPIINEDLFGSDNYDFNGIIKTIPYKTFEMITTLDPRLVYSDTKPNIIKIISALLIFDQVKTDFLDSILESLKQKDMVYFTAAAHELQTQTFLDLFKQEDISKDRTILADIYFYPEKTLMPLFKREAKRAYLPLSDTKLKKIIDEVTDSSFFLSIMDAANQKKDKRTRNNDIAILDIAQRRQACVSGLDAFFYALENDIELILTEGPREMPFGSKFYYGNKTFYEDLKKNRLCIDDKLNMVHEIRQNLQKSELNTTIEQVLSGIESFSKFKKEISNDMLHYISKSLKTKIIVNKVNKPYSMDIFLGYAMDNCLDGADVYRYIMNSDMDVFCFWADGLKIGMSYEGRILQSSNKRDKYPLIDSIEVNNEFFEKKLKKTLHGYSLALMVDRFVNTYLENKLQLSRRGIYVLPDSNNFLIKDSMETFIKDNSGRKALSYNFFPVATDTNFNQIPYFINKPNQEINEEKIKQYMPTPSFVEEFKDYSLRLAK